MVPLWSKDLLAESRWYQEECAEIFELLMYTGRTYEFPEPVSYQMIEFLRPTGIRRWIKSKELSRLVLQQCHG